MNTTPTPKKLPPKRVPQNRKHPQIFFAGKERDYFVENLSLLISSGMPMLQSIDSIQREIRTHAVKQALIGVRDDIAAGAPLWRALDQSGLFPMHAISIIRLGEESGKLAQNLTIVANEMEKSRTFREKMRSAMMYPVFVLVLAVVIGTGIAWYILPRLATVFTQLRIPLPFITRLLIKLGEFLGEYGLYVIPFFFTALGLTIFFVFLNSKTRFIGQRLLFFIPGIKKLIREIEVARFGYLLGTLLEAGLPATNALRSLVSATEFSIFRKFYDHLLVSIEEGNSFEKSFIRYPKSERLIPSSIQQLVFTGERSGALAKVLIKIGRIFEDRSDTTTKNLTVLLEPLMLVIVWIGVVGVALAIILPIYSLIGGLTT